MIPKTRRWLPWVLWLGLAGVLLMLLGSAIAAPVTVTVEWSTASELNTAGFNLYRSNNKDGSYVRINPELIPASTDLLIGGSYVFTDTHVSAGRTYYYRLEEIETNGATSDQGVAEVTADGLNPIWLIAAPIVAAAGLVIWRSRPPHTSISLPHD